MKLQRNSGNVLYNGVIILDTSEIEDEVDYGGMLYELKKSGFKEGEAYQISNAGEILIDETTYKKCWQILNSFGARAVNL